MSDEEKKNWWELPDVPEEQRKTVTELLENVRTLKIAGDKTPRAYLARMMFVAGLIIFNGWIMYINIGKGYQLYTFIYGVYTIIVCLDSLNNARKLREIAKGETTQ